MVPAGALRLWRDLAGVPDVLEPGTRVVVRGSRGLCPPGWTGVVRLGEAWVIEAGTADEDALARLLALEDPSDPAQVATALSPAATLGPGELWYLPEGVLPTDPAVEGEVVEGGVVEVAVDDLADWFAVQPAEDVEESSVADMDRVLVLQRAGAVLGAAGHLQWPTYVGHVGILVAPAARGRGIGTALGAAATRRASEAGLTPQWRAAASNGPSLGAALRIGYVWVGRQLSLQLG